jgi:hypothetical protein
MPTALHAAPSLQKKNYEARQPGKDIPADFSVFFAVFSAPSAI